MAQPYGQIQQGWDVFSNTGEHIASVADVSPAYITISKGLFLPKDYYVPVSAIDNVDAESGRVYIACTKDDLDRMGWDQPTEATQGDATYAGASSADTSYAASPDAVRSQDTNAQAGAGDTQRLQRYEEELRAEKTSREAGEVRVTKDVTEEKQALDVPVTRDEVEVRRVAVNRPASGDDQAFSDGNTVRIPVRAEEVEVTKEPRVVEEIEVRRTPRQETQRVSDTVRKEEFDVEQQGDVNVRGSEGTTAGRELAGAGAGADRFQSQHDWDRPAETESEDSDRTDEERTW